MGAKHKVSDEIINFLRANPNVSHESAAKLLRSAGHEINRRSVVEYRRRYNIEYHGQRIVLYEVFKDIESGITYSNAEELISKYGISNQHANKIILMIKRGQNPERKVAKPVSYSNERKELPPVRVNTFAHMVSQLTANDASYKGAA